VRLRVANARPGLAGHSERIKHIELFLLRRVAMLEHEYRAVRVPADDNAVIARRDAERPCVETLGEERHAFAEQVEETALEPAGADLGVQGLPLEE
jgi:hypothetical protein